MFLYWEKPSRKNVQIYIFRSDCAAVIMGDTIVVFGGKSRDQRGHDSKVKTVEYLVLGENSWKKLPPMHYERAGATACVLP